MQLDELPQDELKAQKIYKHATKYTLMSGKLYKTRRDSCMIRFREEHEITLVLAEEHQWYYGNHIGGLDLVHKLLRVDYYWSALMKDNMAFVNKCEKC